MKVVKIISLPLVLLLILVCFKCCTSNPTPELKGSTEIRQKKKNLNISVFIDLSDRISPDINPMPGMQIFQRDLGYINGISKAFEDHLRSSKVRQAEDYMQVFFEPEPMNTEINSLASKMKLSFDRDNISKESISKISTVYAEGSSRIYELALQDKQFVGSDIWSFFKNRVKDYCIKPNHRNILVILTDGYIYHKDNLIKEGNRSTYITPEQISVAQLNVPDYKELIDKNKFGFIPATDSLENLEVLVLGINPVKGKKFEEDVIKKFWEDWLTGMGVEKVYLKGCDLPSNIGPVIQQIVKN